jgi:hypothetical protein
VVLTGWQQIVIAAHSSGSYVAQELFYLLYTKNIDANGMTIGGSDGRAVIPTRVALRC